MRQPGVGGHHGIWRVDLPVPVRQAKKVIMSLMKDRIGNSLKNGKETMPYSLTKNVT